VQNYNKVGVAGEVKKGASMKTLTVIALLLSSSPMAFSQEIYKWEDEKGVVHYGDNPAHPAATPLDTDTLPYSNTGSLPAESPGGKKARLHRELDEIHIDRAGRQANPSPSLTQPKAWLAQNGRLRLTGSIRNGGKGLCEAPAVEVVILDDNGNVDGSFETAASANGLARGQVARFEGEYFTPVGESLSWDAMPRCSGADGAVYGAHKVGTLSLKRSRIVRLKKFKTK
jgi:hypothetical protein